MLTVTCVHVAVVLAVGAPGIFVTTSQLILSELANTSVLFPYY